jgi:hypothetical protein
MRTGPFADLHRAVGKQLCRLFRLVVVLARQSVPIKNVPFGRDPE